MYFGFTMAEAVLVMTILGIIATIMITTLKPAEFKEKALAILANKVMTEIDTATTQILLNDSRDGTMEKLIAVDGTNFGLGTDQDGLQFGRRMELLLGLYKKYLSASRKACNDNSCSCYKKIVGSGTSPGDYRFVNLKNGACLAIRTLSVYNSEAQFFNFPGEDWSKVSNLYINVSGYIYFDINGLEEPNTRGKDIFRIPLGKYGIVYNEE